MSRDLSRTYFREIKEVYDFVVEQVNAGLFKSDIIDKLIELGVDRMLAFDVIDEMERSLSNLRKRRACMVMSSTSERESIRKEFWISGYDVQLWEDIDGFIASISEHVPDLVIVDALDVDVKGREALALLRQDIIGRKIPVFVLSGEGLMQKDFKQWKDITLFERPYIVDDLSASARKIFLNRFSGEDDDGTVV